jgi:hypothetical protein
LEPNKGKYILDESSPSAHDGDWEGISFREIAAPFRRHSRVFAMLTAYIDESYNNRTFCVAAWILPEPEWRALERDWKKIIERERQESIRQGFVPISRYHASDCSSLKGEFAEENGWDKIRATKLSKKLLGVIIKHKPKGIAMGGSVDLYLKHFPDDRKVWRKCLYYFCVTLVINELDIIRKRCFPEDRISIFYDRGKLGGMADRAFCSLKDEPALIEVSRNFVTAAPMGWEDCLPLQSADLLAFEGMKRVDGHIAGRQTTRKSFDALVGKNVDLTVAGFTDGYYKVLKQNKAKEMNPIAKEFIADENEC